MAMHLLVPGQVENFTISTPLTGAFYSNMLNTRADGT